MVTKFSKNIFFCVAILFHTTFPGSSWQKKAPEGPILFRNNNQESVISSSLVKLSKEKHYDLNGYMTTLFNSKFLDSNQLYPFLRQQNQSIIKVAIPYGKDTINGIFVDRNSDVLIVVGHGFTSRTERTLPFIKLLPNYNLLFFDLPGHGADRLKNPKNISDKLSRGIADADISRMTFGPKECAYITTITQHFRQQKTYQKVIGLGICYSVYYFVQAASEWNKTHETPLFDKIILDSPWLSHKIAIGRIHKLKHWIPSLGGITKHLTRWATSTAAGKNIDKLPPLTHYLKNVNNSDILFMHSNIDKLCPVQDFNLLWQSLSQNPHRSALLLPTKHVMHYKQHKELYSEVIIQFIEQNYNTFVNNILLNR